jgi:hypothetical protein
VENISAEIFCCAYAAAEVCETLHTVTAEQLVVQDGEASRPALTVLHHLGEVMVLPLHPAALGVGIPSPYLCCPCCLVCWTAASTVLMMHCAAAATATRHYTVDCLGSRSRAGVTTAKLLGVA